MIDRGFRSSLRRFGPLPLLAWAVGSACAPAAQSSREPPHFSLACESLDAPTESTLQCVRTDTRNGDARLVDLDRVPITQAASRASDEAPGTYQTVCDATTTSQRSDLWCIRLHAYTGDVVILRLSELPRWPPAP